MERSGQMKKFVLDTSVVVKWFSEYDEDDLDKALGLRSGVLEGTVAVIVPDLLFYELSNALRYNPRFTASDVKEAIQSVVDMGFEVKGIGAHIIDRAVEIAFDYNVTLYDSYFLALSQVEKKPLITADYKFYERVKRIKSIVKLSDIG